MRGPIFLTGATGFVGMELLARYLERTDRRVLALIRAVDDLEARTRLRTALDRMGVAEHGDRVVAVRGDVTLPRLGLDSATWRALAAETDEIVHAAASVSFTLGLEESRAINVAGTRRMLQFAEACELAGGIHRFSYVSTSYVAGTHRGTFGEDDLDVGQRFRNAYERSKFEAEQLVRGAMPRLPIQVFRPSIVVGEYETGWTPAFNVIYWPMRAFARGAYTMLPARAAAPVDVVSISYVADAIYALAGCEDGTGETYALAAGPVASTVGELLDLSARAFDRRPPRTLPQGLYRRTVHPLLLARADERRRTILRASEVFFPYFAMRQRFDTTRVAARLEPQGLTPMPLDVYFGRLVDYAVQAEWGKRELARPVSSAPDVVAA